MDPSVLIPLVRTTLLHHGEDCATCCDPEPPLSALSSGTHQQAKVDTMSLATTRSKPTRSHLHVEQPKSLFAEGNARWQVFCPAAKKPTQQTLSLPTDDVLGRTKISTPFPQVSGNGAWRASSHIGYRTHSTQQHGSSALPSWPWDSHGVRAWASLP